MTCGRNPDGYVPTAGAYRRLLQEVSAAATRKEGYALLSGAKGWILTDIEIGILYDAASELPDE